MYIQCGHMALPGLYLSHVPLMLGARVIMLLFSSAGSLINKMGIPVELVCAVNVNDIVHRMISTGDFTISQDVMQTWSSAMDIQVHN